MSARHRPRLEAVLVDLDGVVTDTAELHFRAWGRLCGELGIPFDRALNERLRGVGRMESLAIILDSAGRSAGREERRGLADRKNDFYRASLRELTQDDLLPGALRFLRQLRGRDLKTALVSASRNAPEVVRRLGIAPLFDASVDPALVRAGKPDPEAFTMAADLLAVPCRHCAGVEDAQAGVDAIRAAGMFAVGVGASLRGAAWTVRDTAELDVDELLRRFRARPPGDVPPSAGPGRADVPR